LVKVKISKEPAVKCAMEQDWCWRLLFRWRGGDWPRTAPVFGFTRCTKLQARQVTGT